MNWENLLRHVALAFPDFYRRQKVRKLALLSVSAHGLLIYYYYYYYISHNYVVRAIMLIGVARNAAGSTSRSWYSCSSIYTTLTYCTEI